MGSALVHSAQHGALLRARWMMRYLYDISSGGTVTLQGSAPFSAYSNLYKTQKSTASGYTDVSGSAFDALDRETTKFSYQVGSIDNTTIKSTQLQYDGGTPAALGLLTQKTIPPANRSRTSTISTTAC